MKAGGNKGVEGNEGVIGVGADMSRSSIRGKDKLTFICWNVGGWSNLRCEADYKSRVISGEDCRQKVADFYQPDLIIVTESWLKEDEVAVLKGYRWWGRNRRNVDKRAIRGSGGVGIFIKEELLKFLDVVILDDTVGN